MNGSIPTTLGKYQVIREIARSNDIVYEGYDPVMNRRAALKELNIAGGSSDVQREERIKRFEREVKAAGSLAHPGIVTIYEFGEDSGRWFMAMEYLDGGTLRNELDTRGFIPQDRALEIIIEVLDALAYAHDHGVIHRDIKPENIQMLTNGHIKLTDFGIARLVFEPNITMDGQVFGTPSYMSPEQVVGKELDARSDLFSVGAVLYEMIGGKKAFGGDSVMSISYAIMNTEPEMPPQCSHGVQMLIQTALNKSPGLRFPTAKEFKQEAQRTLDAIKGGVVQNGPAFGPTMMGSPYSSMPSFAPGAPVPPMTNLPPVYGQQTQFPGYPNTTIPPQPMSYGYAPPNPQQPVVIPIPIYAPKRPPLLNESAKKVLSTVVIAIIGVAILIAIVFVSANSFFEGIQHKAETGAVLVPKLEGSPAAAPAEQAKPEDSKKPSKANVEKSNQYTEQAMALWRNSDTLGAIDLMRQAVDLDTASAVKHETLSNFLGETARNGDRIADMVPYFTEAGDHMAIAADLTPESDIKVRRRQQAADYFLAAASFSAQDDRRGRRDLYRKAKYAAMSGTSAYESAKSGLEQLGG